MAVSAAEMPDSAAQRRRLRRVEAVHTQRLHGVHAPKVAAAVREEAALSQHVPGRPREGLAAVALVVGLEGLRGVDVGVGHRLVTQRLRALGKIVEKWLAM